MLQNNQEIMKMSTKSLKNIVGHVAKIEVRTRSIEVVLVLGTTTKNQKTERNWEKNIEDIAIVVNRLLKRYRNTKRVKKSVEVRKVTQVG